MLGRNHVISAVSGWVLAQPYVTNHQLEPMVAGVSLAAVALGSLLPDIDHPESLLGRRIKFISVPLSFLQGDRSLLPWSEDSHSRGITHSIWALIACWWLFSSQHTVAIAFAFGFAAHLAGDAMTPAGVRLFWPFNIKIRSPLHFRTGGVVEYLFTTILATVAAMQWLGVNVLDQLKTVSGLG